MSQTRGKPGTPVTRMLLVIVAAALLLISAEGPAPVALRVPPGDGNCTVSGATGSTAIRVVGVTEAHHDGVTDDYQALQSALDAASADGGGVVQLGRGTYITDGHLRMPGNVALRGEGIDATVIKAGGGFLDTTLAGGFPVITTDGANNVTVADLTIDQSGNSLDGNVPGRLTAYAMDIRSSRNALLQDVSVVNPFTYAIAAVASTRFCVDGSHTTSATSGRYDQIDGIHVTDSAFGDVVNNTVDQRLGTDGDDGLVVQTIGSAVHDVAFRGNTVRGGTNGSGFQFAVADHPIYNVTVAGNTFWGSPRGIHTGYYRDGNGGLHDITIHNNTFINDGGDAVAIATSPAGDEPHNITVTGNQACNSGGFNVAQSGAAGQVAGNTTSVLC